MKNLRSLRFLIVLCALVMAQLSTPLFATDVSITAGNLIPGANAEFRYGVAGAAITAGQLVYFDGTTSTWKLSDCNSGTAAVRDVDGIAATTSGNGSRITVITNDDDLTIGGTVANGTIYVLSATPGGIAPAADLTSGWYAAVVALGKSSTKVIFRCNLELRTTTAL